MNSPAATPWLTITRGQTPLVISLPHTGTELPPGIEAKTVSPWLARKDADWWIDRLYDFARDLDATIIHTRISRTVIDVNRDPSGVSLYPGQATTELVPITTFDGEPLWRDGAAPDAREIEWRRGRYFVPYHDALIDEIARLRRRHPMVVLYDCHSIRSAVPRLFDGDLPVFNIGTNNGASCAASLQSAIEAECRASPFSVVSNGRFTGGYITRQYGRPADGIHAVQMELACRGYMHEPIGPVSEGQWPTAYDPAYAAPIRAVLTKVLGAARDFAIAPSDKMTTKTRG